MGNGGALEDGSGVTGLAGLFFGIGDIRGAGTGIETACLGADDFEWTAGGGEVGLETTGSRLETVDGWAVVWGALGTAFGVLTVGTLLLRNTHAMIPALISKARTNHQGHRRRRVLGSAEP